ncbi:hypothetical protein [Enterococcus pallens]|uniref:Uncharacterized protein n=1 Tax=Enterococcus pallens ATCC BAA-351 TaxID=1158607 RepID=R2SGQ7_9ENTE|nr:hypothetical protein [Enterococcus pallens]EOH92041.1 hypothetical protein UAU_02940 [Enterococcus pallens ATCC BAA-351]EOU25068.1 hypothetical protein I588_01056 [Enterococcus pallens ATCC BAA-351]OJG72802.1 hypothetical protein RV10_GL004899 [Enterococcus pallens]
MADFFQLIIQIIKNLGIRRFIFILFISATIIQFLRQRLEHRKHEDETTNIDDIYEMDENGLYPWEVDTDDSPERIPKDATRYVNRKSPKRGGW